MILILERRASHRIIRLNNINSFPETNEKLQEIGWGRQDINSEKASDILQKVNVTYAGRDVCARGLWFTEDMICTMGFNASGSCRGDSGGPLILPGISSNSDLQIGIVSYSSIECAQRKFSRKIKQRSTVADE
jgi:secreted trypsin-like serine protease